MHTKDFLAQELRTAGLEDLAKRAETGEFHDFESPHAMPEMMLVGELAAIGTPEADALRRRVINGDFDANYEESEAWAASEEGQAAFDQLMDGK